MNPEEIMPKAPTPPDSGRFNKRLLLLGLGVIVVIIVLAISVFAKKPTPSTDPSKLSIVSTTPTDKDVTNLTRSMNIKFSQPIETSGASITSSPQIITSNTIAGDTLTLTFAPKTLLVSKTYTITIGSISSTTGKTLTNQLITFTPTFIDPTTTGKDALIKIGLSTPQVTDITRYISQFDPWAQNVDIDTSSLKHFKLTPTDAWSPWAVSFSMAIDGANYNVVGDFDDTEHIQIKITDPATKQQLFTAGSPGSY